MYLYMLDNFTTTTISYSDSKRISDSEIKYDTDYPHPFAPQLGFLKKKKLRTIGKSTFLETLERKVSHIW